MTRQEPPSTAPPVACVHLTPEDAVACIARDRARLVELIARLEPMRRRRRAHR